MTELGQIIARLESLSTDQCMLLHVNGAMPAQPGDGIRIQFIGSVAPYTGGEYGTFHPALAHELVKRGVAVFASVTP